MPSAEKKTRVVMATTISGTTSGMAIMPVTSPRPKRSRPRSSASAPAVAMAVEAMVAATAMITLLSAASRISPLLATATNHLQAEARPRP